MKDRKNANREDESEPLRIHKDDLDDVLEIAARLQVADENRDDLYEGRELETIEKTTGVPVEMLAKAHRELRARRTQVVRNVAIALGLVVLGLGATSSVWWTQLFPPDPAAVALEADALRQKATEKRVAKRYDEAIALAEKATRLNPKNYLAWNILGLSHEESGHPVEAREAYLKAVELAGIRRDAAVIYFNLGALYDDTPDTREQAVGYYKKAIQCQPDYSQAHNNLAWTLDEMGLKDEALAEYRAAVKADPSNETAMKNLHAIEARLGKSPVADDLTGNLKGDELRDQAMKLNDAGKYKEAVKVGEQAVKLAPEHVLAWNTLGLSYEGDKRLVDAAKAFRQAIEIGGRHKDTCYPLYNMGRLASDAGKHDEAIQLFKHALTRYPDYAWAHNLLGAEYEEQGRLELALSEYEAAVAADGDNATAKKNMARLSAKTKKQ